MAGDIGERKRCRPSDGYGERKRCRPSDGYGERKRCRPSDGHRRAERRRPSDGYCPAMTGGGLAPAPHRRKIPFISLSFPPFGAKSPPRPQPPHPWRLAADLERGRAAAFSFLKTRTEQNGDRHGIKGDRTSVSR